MVPDLAVGSRFPGHGELWWITSRPQGVEVAQVIDVQPYAIEDPAHPCVVQRQPHGVRVVGLPLPVLQEVRDHGVSCHQACNAVGKFVVMPSIKTCVQQPQFLPGPIVECLVGWWLLLRR